MRFDRRAFTGAALAAVAWLMGGVGRLAAGPIARLFDGSLMLTTGTIWSMWMRGRIAAAPLMLFMPLLNSMQRTFGMSPVYYSRCRTFNGTLFQRLRAMMTYPIRIRRARMEAAILAHEIQCRQMFLTMFATEQVKRFEQILWQMKGAMAVGEAEAQKVLALTEEQKTRVGTIITDYEKKMTAGADEERGGVVGAVSKVLQTPNFTQLKDERDTKINEVLTAEQKAKLTEMQGEPFDAIQKLLKEPLNPSLLAQPEEIPAPAKEGEKPAAEATKGEAPKPGPAKPEEPAKPQAAEKPAAETKPAPAEVKPAPKAT